MPMVKNTIDRVLLISFHGPNDHRDNTNGKQPEVVAACSPKNEEHRLEHVHNPV